MRFNVNEPTTLAAIEQYTRGAGGSNPETVESDTFFNAPQGRDYLTREYQRIKGNPWADPFEDAKRRRSNELMEAALQGYSVSTGSNTGGSISGKPRPVLAPMSPASGIAPLQQQQQPAGIAEAEIGRPHAIAPTATNWLDREVQRATFRAMMEKKSAADRLASPDMQLSTAIPTTGVQFQKHLKQVEQRMNLSGARDLFNKIDPIYFSKGVSRDDPRFAKVQGGKEGKIEASDALDPIASHPAFKQELVRNPQKARDAYYAATNGRNYDVDVAGYSQLQAEQQDEVKRIVQSVKNPEFNRLTGEWTKRVYRWNDDGEYESKQVPLDTREKAAFTADAVERYSGLKMPDKLPPFGETPEEQQRHHQLALQYQAQGKSDEDAYIQAQNDLYKAQRGPPKLTNANRDSDEGLPAWAYADPRDWAAPAVNALAAPLNWSKAPWNVPLRGINAAMAVAGSESRIPLIPDLPRMDNIPVPPEDIHFRPKAVRALYDFMAPRLRRASQAFQNEPTTPLFTPPRRKWRELGDLN